MPTRLIVMRHASSGWNSPQQLDHDRVLTEGGRLEAPRMSKALIDLDWIPDIAIVSSSARTRETHSLLMDTPHEIRREIYGASLETLLPIAEGIETELQMQLLLAAGCDYGQGYLFSKPLNKIRFMALLADKKMIISI